MGCAKSQDWLPTTVEAWSKTSADEDTVVIVLTMPQDAHVVYGGKYRTQLSYTSCL